MAKTLTPKQILPIGAAPGANGNWTWRKKGGSADRTIRLCLSRARAAGFTSCHGEFGGVPDGSVVRSGTYYRDPAGNVLYVSSTYGTTPYDNRFRIEYRPAGTEG